MHKKNHTNSLILGLVLLLTAVNSVFIFMNAKETNAIKRIVEVDSGLVYDSIEGIKVQLGESDDTLQQELENHRNTTQKEFFASMMRMQQDVFNNTESNICLHYAETDSASGRSFIPILEDYQWGFFGQVFTMDDCRRFQEITGLALAPGAQKNSTNASDYVFTDGSDIVFTSKLDTELPGLLLEVGYKCQEKAPEGQEQPIDPSQCRHWKLDKNTPVDKILKLKPYANIAITSSDCVMCR